MLFCRRFLLVLVSLSLLFPAFLPGQVASITLRELTITPNDERFRSFDGIPQTFTPGEDNVLVVNAPVDFAHREATVTATVDYSFDMQRETTGGALIFCSFTVPEFPNQPGTAFVIRVDQGSSAGSASGFVAEGRMILTEEKPEEEYTYRCGISDPADFQPIAEQQLILRQRYEFLDTIEIVDSSPPSFLPLAAGSTQSFTATVEHTLDTIRLGGLAVLVATDSSGRELVPRTDRGINPSAERVSRSGPEPVQIQLTLPDVPIPEDGFVALHAELVNGRQFAAWEDLSFQTYIQSEPVEYGEESDVDYSIWHIEINQVVQDDDNLIPLVADKPGVVRVFVRTPARPEPETGAIVVPVKVTLRRDGEERVFARQALAALAPTGDGLFAIRNSTIAAATVPIPLELTGAGELEVEAVVNLEGGEPILPEANAGNNTRTETFRFRERDTLALGYLALGTMAEKDPTASIRKLFPLSPTRGLAYFEAAAPERRPGETQTEADARAILAASMTAMSGLADVMVLWYEDERGAGALRVGALLTAAISNARTVWLEDNPNRSDASRLAALVADRLLSSAAGPRACDPATAGQFAGVGWDAGEARLIDLSLHKDLMTGCVGKGNQWVSPERYARLFLRDFFGQPSALREESARQGPLELAGIAGQIRADGGGSLQPLVRFSGVQSPPLEDAGEYCVEASGAGGSARHCFTPQFGPAEALPFAVILPAETTTSVVRLMRNGVEVDSLSASASAPAITISSPAAGAAIDAGPPLTAAWNASDADGDPLRTSLFVSADGGAIWAPLATNVEGGSHQIDTTRLPGGEQVMLRAVVSDGLRTAQDEVGPFAVRQTPAAEAPASLDLGESAAGVPVSALLPIESTGTGPLRIVAAQTDNPAFTVASPLPFELLPGTPGGLEITATPPSAGAHSATLTLDTNAGAPVTVQLSATGLDPEQPILDVTLDGDAIVFPDTRIGETSEATVSLVNRGRMPLTYQAAIEGPGFSLLAPQAPAQADATLRAGEQRDLLIRFSPEAPGDLGGALRIISDAPNLSARTITLTGRGVEAPSLPIVNAGGVVDAASFQAKLAPGGIGSLFGTGLAGAVSAATGLPLPTSLGGVRVLVDGAPAPLFFVSPNQINFQLPYEAPREGSVEVTVSNAAGQSAPVTVSVGPYAPALFANPATGEPIVTRPDNTLITAANPADVGDVLVLFVTGLGDLDNTPASGSAAGAEPLSRTRVLPTVTVGGAPAQVFFAGLSPGFVGLGQINIQVPEAVAIQDGAAVLNIDFEGNASEPVMLPMAP